MQIIALILLLLLAGTNSTLLEDRMAAVKVWILRTNSSDQMNLAFTDQYSTPEVTHIVRDTADYGPREIALEYDRIILDLVFIFGFNPSMLTSHYDPSTTKWLDTDTIQVDFNVDVKTEYDLTTGVYNVDAKGFRYTDIYVFESGTSRVELAYSIQDPAAIKAFAHADTKVSSDFICSFYIFPSCNGTTNNYIADTGYTSVQDCVSFLDSLSASPHPCPYATRSNTPTCRQTHAWSSALLPSVHCQHTGKQSVTCVDSCLPACANCHPDAECVPTYPTLFAPVYQCQCKNGYIGNGTFCQAQKCSNGGICPAKYGTYECSTGDCKCTETFTHNPQATGHDNLCTCNDGGAIRYNGSTPVCVPVGKCLGEQYECTIQNYNQVKCLSPGENIWTSFKSCVCNYGFLGGYEYPCQCPAGKRVVWSDAHSGSVCLSTDECTTAWHCNYPKHCQTTANSLVGQCVA